VEGHREFGDPEGLLFDLAGDPDERVNLRAERLADVDALALSAARHAAGLVRHMPIDQETGAPLAADAADRALALPDEEQQRLRALGYVD
jgi:hypothetical protein